MLICTFKYFSILSPAKRQNSSRITEPSIIEDNRSKSV